MKYVPTSSFDEDDIQNFIHKRVVSYRIKEFINNEIEWTLHRTIYDTWNPVIAIQNEYLIVFREFM